MWFRRVTALQPDLAVAHYNLAYLLKTKGDQRMAAYHFQQAAVADPSLASAKYWVAELNSVAESNGTSRQAQRPPAIPSAPVELPAVQIGVPTFPARPTPASGAASPTYVADRSPGPRPQVRVMPPPPRRSAPLPGNAAPRPDAPQFGHGPALQPSGLGTAPMPGGLQAPMPNVGRSPQMPVGPPLPPDSRRPPPVRRLPTIN